MPEHIVIDLCGRLADPVGASLTLPLKTPAPVATILARLSAEYPALGNALSETRLHHAIDEALVPADANIAPGQRLALFPPVSGG